MLKNQVHPAAIRSKNLIAESLLTLMTLHDYDKITIKEITDEAVLTRRTFYAHFKTKDDVLDYKISKLNQELVTDIINHQGQSHHIIALIYFSFWIQHVDLLNLMKKQNLMPLLFVNFENNIREIRSLFGCQLTGQHAIYGDYSSAYFTSILSGILDKWISTGAKETAEELVDLLEFITMKLASNFSETKSIEK